MKPSRGNKKLFFAVVMMTFAFFAASSYAATKAPAASVAAATPAPAGQCMDHLNQNASVAKAFGKLLPTKPGTDSQDSPEPDSIVKGSNRAENDIKAGGFLMQVEADSKGGLFVNVTGIDPDYMKAKSSDKSALSSMSDSLNKKVAVKNPAAFCFDGKDLTVTVMKTKFKVTPTTNGADTVLAEDGSLPSTVNGYNLTGSFYGMAPFTPHMQLDQTATAQ